MATYQLKGHKRCLILDYLNLPDDVASIKLVFEMFNFTVDCPPKEMLTSIGTKEMLQEASISEHGQCLVIFILCSGDHSEFICFDGESLPFNTIFESFDSNHCISMKGNPKLFFIKNNNIVQQSNGGLTLSKPSDSSADDFFICSSTCSQFIRTLCNVIFSKYKTYDVQQLVTLVREILNEALGEKCSRDSTLMRKVKLEV